MKCIVKFPSDFKFIISTFDIEEIVRKLRCPLTVLQVVDSDEKKLDELPGYYNGLITVCNPNCPGSAGLANVK